jgi:hypothetical protein
MAKIATAPPKAETKETRLMPVELWALPALSPSNDPWLFLDEENPPVAGDIIQLC